MLLDFKSSDLSATNVDELLQKEELGGAYLIIGYIKWVTGTTQNVNGKNIREAIFQDSTGKIPITFWKKHIYEIQEDNCYKITNISLKSYFRKK